jgi:hypothetical protein
MRNLTTEARRHGGRSGGRSIGQTADQDGRSRFHRAWINFRATLREIFDESAYERFLLRTSGVRSVASYRDFMQERAAAMSKKPRCC